MKKPTGEIAIIFNKKDKLFELFQVVPMGTTFQRDGVNFCGIQFRIENDVLGNTSKNTTTCGFKICNTYKHFKL